jgi:hypothetical protein
MLTTLPTGLSLSLLLGSSLAQAPCAPQWQDRSGAPGLHPHATTPRDAVLWDPDGAGPLGPRVVVLGDFVVADDVSAHNIAAWDPVSGAWQAFGSGIAARLDEAVGLPNGDLVAAGTFDFAGGVPTHNIARWDGIGWHPLGAGIEGTPTAMAAMPNGDLVVAGMITAASGQPVGGIARWDGSTWSTMAGGMNGTVWALAVSPAGELHAGGFFTLAGGQPATGLAKWTGNAWVAVPFSGWVMATQLDFAPNGNLVALGRNSTFQQHVIRWDGSAWVSLGRVDFWTALALRCEPNGGILLGGDLVQVAGVPVAALARYDGSGWQAVKGFTTGNSIGEIQVLPSGEWLVAGTFASAGAVVASNVARYDGSEWYALATGTQGTSVSTLAQFDDERVVAGGHFGMLAGAAGSNLAVHDGNGWQAHPVGWGGRVRAVGECQGQMVVGGDAFDPLASSPMHAARWDGAAWHSLGNLGGPVLAMTRLANGHLLLGGDIRNANSWPTTGLALWTGTTLMPFAAAPPYGQSFVRALWELPNGDIVAGGDFTWLGQAGSVQNLARWNGTTWVAVGGAPNGGVHTVARTAVGDLVVGGTFTSVGGVPCAHLARWDGNAWSACGSGLDGPVYAVAELPNGDLLVAGDFEHAGGTAAANLARWNGSAWSPVAGGLDGPVEAMLVRAGGEVMLGGSFARVDGQASVLHATLAPGCPATATVVGTGCQGAAGPHLLASTREPWVGTTWTAVDSGLLPGSLLATLYGFSNPDLPLLALTPFTHPACRLLAHNQAWSAQVATGPTATTSLTIPNSVQFAGLVVHHQVLALEFGPVGTPLLLTGSNGLRLQLGAF